MNHGCKRCEYLTMPNRFSRATLSIYSDTHPASEVTAILGLTPTKTWEKDDRRFGLSGREYPAHTQSGWSYDPDDSQQDPADDSGFASLRLLVADLRDKRDAIASLRPRYQTVIRWSGDSGSTQGNFVVTADLIVDLGLLGCEFWGTLYGDMEAEAGDSALGRA